MACNLQVVFVSHDGIFFRVDATDLTVAPFANIVQYVDKIHADEMNSYFMVKISHLILEYIFSRSSVQYEVMKLNFFDSLKVIFAMVELDTIIRAIDTDTDTDNTPNRVDDILASFTKNDVMHCLEMDLHEMDMQMELS